MAYLTTFDQAITDEMPWYGPSFGEEPEASRSFLGQIRVVPFLKDHSDYPLGIKHGLLGNSHLKLHSKRWIAGGYFHRIGDGTIYRTFL